MLLGHVEELEFRTSGLKSVHSYANLAVKRLEDRRYQGEKDWDFKFWNMRTKQKKSESRHKVIFLLERQNLFFICSKS